MTEFGTRPEDIVATLDMLQALESHNTRFTQIGITAEVLEVGEEEYTEERVLEYTAKMRDWIEDPERIPITEQQGLERDIMGMTYQDTLAQLGLTLGPVRPNPEQTLPTIQGDEIFGDVHLQLTDGRSLVSFLRNIACGEHDFADLGSCVGLHFLTEFSYLMAHEPEDAHLAELTAHAGDIKEALENLGADAHIPQYLEEIRKHAVTDTVSEGWHANDQWLLVPPDVQLEYEIPGPASWHKSMNEHSLEFHWTNTLDLIKSVKSKPTAREFYETLVAAAQA